MLTPEFKGDEARTLLFLPLAHVLARIIHIGALMARAKLGYCWDTRQLLPELASFQPTFLLTIPRVLEKVYNSASQKAHAEGKGKIFDAAAATAIAWSKAKYEGRIPVGLNLKHKVFDRLVYGKLRAALGGRTTTRDLRRRPARRAADPLLQRHRPDGLRGLRPDRDLPRDRGEPDRGDPARHRRPAAARRHAADRARTARSRPRATVVFHGYWNNDEATASVMTEDGFFMTGDLGELDQDGYLTITGRKKELLVTSGGKNVAPAVLEDRLNAHALVAQSMVVGDAKPFISALITLDPESLPHWLSSTASPRACRSPTLCKDPDLLAELQAAVDDANKAVSQGRAVRKFEVLAGRVDHRRRPAHPEAEHPPAHPHGRVRREDRGDVRALRPRRR